MVGLTVNRELLNRQRGDGRNRTLSGQIIQGQAQVVNIERLV